MEFPSQDKPVIIAIKGLPFSGDEHVHCNIAAWTMSVVFRLNDILEELHKRGGYDATSKPPKEEDERLQRLAFSTLCRVGKYQTMIPNIKWDSVIINSGLSSVSQLDELIRMAESRKAKLLIIECRTRHMYIWKKKARKFIGKYRSVWFIPKGRHEIEKAIDDYDGKAWDKHYRLQCSTHPRLHLKRLVLDPSLDLLRWELNGSTEAKRIPLFGKAIEYLLTNEAAPPVVD